MLQKALGFVLALGVVVFAQSALAAEIDWEVKHKFRFFDTEADAEPNVFFKMQQQAFDEMRAEPGFDPAEAVSKLELKLNNQAWLAKFYAANKEALRIRDDEVNRGAHPHWGWSKKLVNESRTCWNAREQWHSDCRSDAVGASPKSTYAQAERHTVIARLPVAIRTEARGQTCTWSTDETSVFLGQGRFTKSINRDCADDVTLRIPFKPDAQSGVSASTIMRVQYGADAAQMLETAIAVRDILIVGMGDSFSSGEGNPDSPVIMHQRPSKTARFEGRRMLTEGTLAAYRAKALNLGTGNFDVKVGGVVPHRDNASAPANWLDRNCHRSMYSYHMRVALQAALSAPKTSTVTFLGYACSGAKVSEGLLLDYDGVESVSPSALSEAGRLRRNASQVARMIEELCKTPVSMDRADWRQAIGPDGPITVVDFERRSRERYVAVEKPVMLPVCGENRPEDFVRPIDMMIVSIGGNDVGFASLVADTYLSRADDFEDGIIAKKNLLAGLANQFIGHGVDVAEQRLQRLDDKFDALINTLDQSGVRVQSHLGSSSRMRNVVLTAFPFVEYDENGDLCGSGNGVQSALQRRRGATLTGEWFEINPQKLQAASDFAGDLTLAQRAAASAHNMVFVDAHRPVFRNHGICARAPGNKETETMHIPLRLPTKWFPDNRHQAWYSQCYESRQRWYRTFDDAFLCANTLHGRFPRQGRSSDTFALLSLGGPVHPTAEGHAHIADAVWNDIKARDILK